MIRNHVKTTEDLNTYGGFIAGIETLDNTFPVFSINLNVFRVLVDIVYLHYFAWLLLFGVNSVHIHVVGGLSMKPA